LPTPQESGTLSKQSSLDAGSNSSLGKLNYWTKFRCY
jgi:hypothetical protein